jgi:hypothetical protein
LDASLAKRRARAPARYTTDPEIVPPAPRALTLRGIGHAVSGRCSCRDRHRARDSPPSFGHRSGTGGA